MTYDEAAVLDAVRSFPRGRRVPRQDVLNKARLPLDRLNKALAGLEASGHVWLDGDMVKLSSDGTTFDT
ncbi:MAG TPA: hypothetical protein VJR58_02055 [Vineibacter sp.]|nr:hypothetical protein [Vineibacter sp.]